MNESSAELRGWFITGTDTGVGKTYVTRLLARQLLSAGHSMGVYKPVCTGSETDAAGRTAWSDIDSLSAAVDGRFPAERICPQRFHAPLAPPVAARLEGKHVDADLLHSGARWWAGRVDWLLVEGVGGFLCPLSENESVADLAVDLRLPLIVVARLGLGTINHTLLTLEAAERRNLPIAGIVLNQPDGPDTGVAAETNPAEIAARTTLPILGVIGHNQPCEIKLHGIDVLG